MLTVFTVFELKPIFRFRIEVLIKAMIYFIVCLDLIRFYFETIHYHVLNESYTDSHIYE